MHLLGISGSLRAASFNSQLLQAAARAYAPKIFATASLNLPLYSGDTEAEGLPKSVDILAKQIAQADAIAIATPEYNKGMSGVLKNALDWVSRVEGNPWAGKPVVLMSATAGRTGGEMAVASLRLCMAPFNVRIVPGPSVLVAGCHKELVDGALVSESYQTAMQGLMDALKAEVAKNK